MFLGWMYAAFPIGWTISHLLLLAVYYFVLTPVGLALRLTGRDPVDLGRIKLQTATPVLIASKTARTETVHPRVLLCAVLGELSYARVSRASSRAMLTKRSLAFARSRLALATENCASLARNASRCSS